MAFTATQFKRQVGTTSVPIAGTIQFTVPGATQEVIKTIDVSNPTGGTITFSMSMAAANIFSNISLGAGATLHWTGTQVLGAGETIVTSASGVGLHLLVSGLENT